MPTLEVLPRPTPEERADQPVPIDVDEALAERAETIEAFTEPRQNWEFTLQEGHDFGRANNVAEYRALVAGLEKALELHVDEVEVVSDSELLVKQMRGEYKVKNAALRELSEEAAEIARQLRAVRYTAVRREHNELADQLVNEALDGRGA